MVGSSPTIIEYTDQSQAICDWPTKIISPTKPSRCCMSMMQTVGHPHHDGISRFQYKVCRTCGFAVRSMQDYPVPEYLFWDLRQFFARNIVKGY